MADDACGLASLDVACMHRLCLSLDARDAARLQATCRALRVTAGDEGIWRALCSRDFDVDEPTSPSWTPSPSFSRAYAAWHAEYGRYGAYFLRAKRAVAAIRGWAAVHAPPIAASLLPGASEADVDALAASLRLPSVADSVRVVWRLLGGQFLQFDASPPPHDFHESALHGLFGSYAVYDHLCSVRMLPLAAAAQRTQLLLPGTARPPLVLFAASFNMDKTLFVDTVTADVSVVLRSHRLNPAAPAYAGSGLGSRDGLLRWLEHFASDLARQRYAFEEVEPGAPLTRGLCLFPRLPPELSVAVTRGVRVEASAVWMPEVSHEQRDAFVYRVCFSMQSLDEQAAAGVEPPVRSVQLQARHWVIQEASGAREEVNGPGVIGEYPILRPGAPAFVYQSQTPLRRTRDARGGRMWGSFTFVCGTNAAPVGPAFEAECAPFPLAVPEYAV